MSNIKVLSSSGSFGVLRFENTTKKIIHINDFLTKFFKQNNLNPGQVLLDLRTAIAQDSAHLSISGVEFLVNFEKGVESSVVFMHQISTVSNQHKAILPEDELHKMRIMSLGEMTAGIIHDINNPLSLINSGAELAIFSMEDIESATNEADKKYAWDELSRQLKIIKEGSTRITQISEGVRALMHKNQINFQTQDLSKILVNSVACCVSFLRKSGIEFTFQNEGVAFLASCKESLLVQVFINLIKNSHDAIKDLPLHRRFIDVSISSDKDFYYIKFQDGGSGIPLGIQQKIFDPFFTTKKMGEGTGVGLSLCKKIMEAHGGDLKLDNNSNNTTFILTVSKKNIR